MTEPLYRYRWQNNPVRARWKGRIVRVLRRFAMQSVLIEDVETGEKMCTSRRALRKEASK